MKKNAAIEHALYFADEESLERFAGRLATVLNGTELVALNGPLGAGKTTFSRGLLRALGHTGSVKSPTFTLVEPYEHLSPPVFHFDLYRIADPEELELIGFRDYLGEAVLLIEWAERLREWPVPFSLALTLAHADAGRAGRLEVLSDDLESEQIQEIVHEFAVKT